MPQQNSELSAIKRILGDNINKNFVQRIMYPNQSPKIFDNPDPREPSTHSMAWGTGENGRAFVYPTVVQTENGLIRLSTKERPTENMDAGEYAFKTGEFIEVDSAAKADWLSKNYKKVWEQ